IQYLNSFPTRRSSDLSLLHMYNRTHLEQEMRQYASLVVGKKEQRNDPYALWQAVLLMGESCSAIRISESAMCPIQGGYQVTVLRSEEHTSELQSPDHL